MGKDSDKARETVLRAIEGAQRAAGIVPVGRSDPLLHTSASSAARGGDLALEQMVERLGDYQASVVDLRSRFLQSGPSIVGETVGNLLLDCGAESVVVAKELRPEFRPVGVRVVEDDQLSATELEQIACGVTTCLAAVAESGTLLLDHVGAQGRRVICLIPDIHVCILQATQVFDRLPEALQAIGSRPLMTWISGPSATSDIELVRVEGVHGPRRLIVIMVP